MILSSYSTIALTKLSIMFFLCFGFFGTVPNHSLKRGTIIRLCGERSVNVRLDDLNIVLLGKRHTFSQLSFNTFFPLIIGRIPCINHTIHSFSPLLQSLLDISAPETICQLKQILDLACQDIGKQVQRFQLRSLEIFLSLLIGLDRFQADAGYP